MIVAHDHDLWSVEYYAWERDNVFRGCERPANQGIEADLCGPTDLFIGLNTKLVRPSRAGGQLSPKSD
jgi:hypothetical protein